jgi:hypothetical protein
MHRYCRLHPCAIWALLDPQELSARHTEVTMLELRLTPIEVRILGALLEKEVTTAEYYPLTLNALTRACSQNGIQDVPACITTCRGNIAWISPPSINCSPPLGLCGNG